MTTKTDRYGEHLSIKDARSIASAYGLNNNILSRDNNTKLNKSTGRTAGYLNASLALALINPAVSITRAPTVHQNVGSIALV